MILPISNCRFWAIGTDGVATATVPSGCARNALSVSKLLKSAFLTLSLSHLYTPVLSKPTSIQICYQRVQREASWLVEASLTACITFLRKDFYGCAK